MDAYRVFVEFGAARAPADRFDFRNLGYQPLGDQAEPIRLCKRYAGIELKFCRDRSFVERRQEAARQQRRANTGGADTDRESRNQQRTMIESPVEQELHAVSEMPQQEAVARWTARSARQEEV